MSEMKSDVRSILDCFKPAAPTPAKVAKASTPPDTTWPDFYRDRLRAIQDRALVTRAEAEHRAWEWTVVEWLRRNPGPANEPADGCAHCGRRMADVEAIPVLRGSGGHTWLHGACHEPWMRARREQAVSALAAMGINHPGEG